MKTKVTRRPRGCISSSDLLLFEQGCDKLTEVPISKIKKHLIKCSNCRDRAVAVKAEFEKVVAKIMARLPSVKQKAN